MKNMDWDRWLDLGRGIFGVIFLIAGWVESAKPSMKDHIDYHKQKIKKRRDAIINKQNDSL